MASENLIAIYDKAHCEEAVKYNSELVGIARLMLPTAEEVDFVANTPDGRPVEEGKRVICLNGRKCRLSHMCTRNAIITKCVRVTEESVLNNMEIKTRVINMQPRMLQDN